ncbi:hypothetical protein MKW98_015795, partial [Papaver atlanticum]
ITKIHHVKLCEVHLAKSQWEAFLKILLLLSWIYFEGISQIDLSFQEITQDKEASMMVSQRLHRPGEAAKRGSGRNDSKQLF